MKCPCLLAPRTVCLWSLYGTAVPFRANGLGGRTRPYRLTRVRAHTCARAGPVLLRYKLDLVRTAWSSVAEHVAPYHASTRPRFLPRFHASFHASTLLTH